MSDEVKEAAAPAEEKACEKETAQEETCEEEKVQEETPESEEKDTVIGRHAKLKKEIAEKDKEIAELKKQIEVLNGNVADLKNAYAKAYADAENTKKRLNNEFEQRSKYRAQEFTIEILPVLDNCERALALEAKDDTDAAYRKGFEMVYKQLLNALKKEGVVEIEALGKPFDPNWHQAMMSETVDGVEPGMVTAVLQKGYMLKDRLLRAAMVKVSE